MTPVTGAEVYGLLPPAVREPHGNPSGNGLLVKKGGKVGACNVPHKESLSRNRQLISILPFCEMPIYPLVCC